MGYHRDAMTIEAKLRHDPEDSLCCALAKSSVKATFGDEPRRKFKE